MVAICALLGQCLAPMFLLLGALHLRKGWDSERSRLLLHRFWKL